MDPAGNLYIADAHNNRIRKVSGGTITTVAGDGTSGFSGDGGPATGAALNMPFAEAVDAAGNLYIAVFGNSRMRKVSAGIISTVSGNGTFAFSGDGGPATSAGLFSPSAVALDPAGNVYFADTYNERIRKVSSGIITTAAGNGAAGFSGDGGPAAAATLNGPWSAAVDSAGNIYVADPFSNRIRRVSQGVITTVAGNGAEGFSGDGGPATGAALDSPYGVAVDSAGNLYIADTLYDRIRKVSASGVITTIAGGGSPGLGDQGPATSASLSGPYGVAVDSAGNLYIADSYNQRIRKVSGGIITTVAGEGVNAVAFSGDGGPAVNAGLFTPTAVALDSTGNLYIVDNLNNRVREVLVGPVSLVTSPLQLTFEATAGGTAAAAQSVNLVSSVAGLSFSFAVSDPWLTVTPSSGSTPAVLRVSVDPSQLTATTYTGSITIAAPGTSQTVSVSLNVSPAAKGKLAVSSPNLSFSSTQGSASSSAQLSVSNQGGGSIAFTAISTGGDWLQVSPASGTATAATAASLTVTAAPGSLGPGTYSGSAVVSSSTTGENITVPVTLSITAVQQSILLSQAGLTFTAVQQGGAPLPQNFGVLNTGQGPMSWSASASTLSGGSWLSIDRSGGTVATPFTGVSLVNAAVNPSGLQAGNYYGQIQVTSPGAANSPHSVSVVLNVLPAGSNPGPEVRPSGLIFIGAPGDSPGSQNVMVSNPQGSPITFGGYFFTVPTGGNWLQFLPTNATVQPNAPAQVVVQPDYTSLQSGVYQGFVSLGFLDGSSRSVHILSVVAPPGGGGNASQSGGSLSGRAASVCTTLHVNPTALTDPSSNVTVGQGASLQARVVDNCGNLMTTGSLQATFSSGDAAVNLVHVGQGNWSGTWTPQKGTQSQVTIEYVAFQGQGTTLLSGSANLTVSFLPGVSAPVTSGAANAASGVGTYISPGGLVSIYGQQLADQTEQLSSAPFPTQLNGTQVLMGGKALPLRYVGGAQVNAQVPFDLGINTSQQLVVQRDTTLSVPQNVVVAAAQPAVYTQNQSGSGPGVIVEGSTNALITSANPASAGDVVVIYANGLGAVSPPVPTGSPAPSAEPLARTVNPVTVTVGGIDAQVQFAGLAPGYPDLYQVNAVVPAGVASGAAPVVLTVAGQLSPPVTIAIQ